MMIYSIRAITKRRSKMIQSGRLRGFWTETNGVGDPKNR